MPDEASSLRADAPEITLVLEYAALAVWNCLQVVLVFGNWEAIHVLLELMTRSRWR